MILVEKTKTSLKKLFTTVNFVFINKKLNTNIKSNQASIRAHYSKYVIVEKGTIISEDVKIGDFSYVNAYSSLENCEIGKFCSISSGVYISPAEHNLKCVTTHPIVKVNNDQIVRKKTIIGNDVLISLNVIILEGIQIGDGAVIAAGAVVTRDVEPYEVVGGVPAKHIKYRFDYEYRSYLKKLEWWEWPEEKIRSNMPFLRKDTEKVI